MEKSKKLFIGNLSFATTSEALQAIFEQFGEVLQAEVICDKRTNKPKGFGYVTFEKDEHADAALSLNGFNCDGKNIRVSIAKS